MLTQVKAAAGGAALRLMKEKFAGFGFRVKVFSPRLGIMSPTAEGSEWAFFRCVHRFWKDVFAL